MKRATGSPPLRRLSVKPGSGRNHIMNTDTELPNHEKPSSEVVTVSVNNNDVRLPEKKVTGLEIKQAAIAQGVNIELGFTLFRVTGSQQHQVRDRDDITVHEGEQFRCVRPDDNS